MKTVFLSTLFLFSFLSFSQSINVSIQGKIVNSDFKDAWLFKRNKNDSLAFHETFKIDDDGSFSLKTKIPSEDYYTLAFDGDLNASIELILRNDSSDIKIYGDGSNITKFCNIVNSDESQQMLFFKRELNKWRKTLDSAEKIVKTDPSRKQELTEAISPKFYSFKQYQQNYVAQNQNSAALLPLLELFPMETQMETYEILINQIKIGIPKSILIQKELKKLQAYKAKKALSNPLAIGKLAPDFEELGRDGSSKLKLSSLRGKVVLLDFWASWCAPCRRENPSVVRLYNKYNKDGFTVLSVSLDSNKDKWIEAISKDSLIWPNHVSDLGGWRSKASKLYGVSSIPFTVLIDEEGKIIATNLRGAALENKLSFIFEK